MSPSSSGGRRVREYVPPHLEDAMHVTRIANANWVREGGNGMRYVVVCNVHEGIDPDLPIQILDSMDETYLFVAELLQRLPEGLRKQTLRNYR